jgi:hypothetical protein
MKNFFFFIDIGGIVLKENLEALFKSKNGLKKATSFISKGHLISGVFLYVVGKF